MDVRSLINTRSNIVLGTKFGEVMLEVTRAEALYGTNLRDIGRELTSLYFKWISNLALRRTDSYYYSTELERLEFSVQNKILEDILKKASELVANLDRLFFVDTNELTVAIDKSKRQRIEAEKCFTEEGNHIKGIMLLKNTVNDLFETYSDTTAKKRNLQRNALKKWCGILGAIYFPAMGLYFVALNYMEKTPDFILGVVVPVFAALVCLAPLFYIFYSEE